MELIRKFFSRRNASPLPVSKGSSIEPRPADWTLTTGDLFNQLMEGKRKKVGNPEIQWARDYERSLLPDGIRFPKAGDVYLALEDVTVHVLTSWAAPFTGGGEAVFPRGGKIRVHEEVTDPRPLGIHAMPLDDPSVHFSGATPAEQSSPLYRGCCLYIETALIHTGFQLLTP